MVKEIITENAVITSTKITMEDHGCLTFWIFVDMGGSGCGIGGYCIGNGYVGAKQFSASGSGLEAMMRIMDVVGVGEWEKLPGKYIRVKHDGWGGTISEIGNILNYKWFNLKAFFEEKQKEAKVNE